MKLWPDRLRENPKASVLVFSLIILSIVLVTALTIAGNAVVNQKQSQTVAKSNQAFQTADSSVEIFLEQLYKKDNATPAALNTTLGTTCVDDGSFEKKLVSGGSYKVTLFDNNKTVIPCNDTTSTTWRDDVVSLRAEGTEGDTSRVIETAVAAVGKLECVTGSIDINGNKNIDSQINVSGLNWDQVFAEDTFNATSNDSWGLECKSGWVRTGCAAGELGDQHDASMDGDLMMYNNGCKTDDEERLHGRNVIQAVCCR